MQGCSLPLCPAPVLSPWRHTQAPCRSIRNHKAAQPRHRSPSQGRRGPAANQPLMQVSSAGTTQPACNHQWSDWAAQTTAVYLLTMPEAGSSQCQHIGFSLLGCGWPPSPRVFACSVLCRRCCRAVCTQTCAQTLRPQQAPLSKGLSRQDTGVGYRSLLWGSSQPGDG